MFDHEKYLIRMLVALFLLLVLLTWLPVQALAESSSLNLAIPSAPQNYQSDKFKAGDLDCANAIGSASQLEFGVTGMLSQDYNYGFDDNKDVGVYARITIPIGKVAKERIDCNRLYELELRRRQLEVQKLEQELQALRNLQFEN